MFDKYETPYTAREYASPELLALWGAQHGWSTARRVWHAIAEAQKSHGVNISNDQIEALADHVEITPEELARAREIEEVTRHDVVAHKDTYGEACPGARSIIHLGSTSCDVTDNRDLIIMRDSLGMVRSKCAHVVRRLRNMAEDYTSTPILGRTHLMPAAPSTVGLRLAMWLEPVADSLHHLLALERAFPLRGLKGAVGTMDSYARLLGHISPLTMEREFCARLGFARGSHFYATGQTYPRVFDFWVLAHLAELAAQCGKIASDLQLMAGFGEWQPPFAEGQRGSSAMPHKRNPNCEERCIGLARSVAAHLGSAFMTASTQKLERSIDDSVGRRIYVAESFFAVDACLDLLHYVFAHGTFRLDTIEMNLKEHMALALCDKAVTDLAKAGMDRQKAYDLVYAYAQRVQSGEIGGEAMVTEMRNDPRLKALSLQAWMTVPDRDTVPMSYDIIQDLIRHKLVPLMAAERKAPKVGRGGEPRSIKY